MTKGLIIYLLIQIASIVNISNDTRSNYCPRIIYSMGPVGGYEGSPFNDRVPTLYKLVHPYILKIRSDTSIKFIQIIYQDAFGNIIPGDPHGGEEGVLSTWTVPQNERIIQANVYAGERVYSLQFITDKNTYSPRWGGLEGSFYNVSMVGSIMTIFGRNQTDIIQIGFTVCDNGFVN